MSVANSNYGMVGTPGGDGVELPPARNPLHRLGAVRRLQGVSRRAIARRLNVEILVVKEQEKETTDLPLSALYRWQKLLDVPVAELLVDTTDPLSLPVMERDSDGPRDEDRPFDPETHQPGPHSPHGRNADRSARRNHARVERHHAHGTRWATAGCTSWAAPPSVAFRPTCSWTCWIEFRGELAGREKGDSPHLPERPGGCFAQMGTVPFFLPVSAENVAGWFAERFGQRPCWIVRPGRVNLIGEHTDYNDGFVLPMAIDRAIWIALRPRGDRLVARIRPISARTPSSRWMTCGRRKAAGPNTSREQPGASPSTAFR